MKRLLTSFALIGFLAACGTQEAYQADIEQWIGKTDEAVLEHWGDPAEYQQFDDGAAFMSYRTYEIPGFAIKTPITIGERTCWTRFQINKNGIVTSVRSIGGSCRR